MIDKEKLDSLRSRVLELQTEIGKLGEEIQAIQKECPHPEYYLMYYSWRIGCMEPRRFCKICDDMLPDMPTAEELGKFHKEEEEKNRIYWEEHYPDLPYLSLSIAPYVEEN